MLEVQNLHKSYVVGKDTYEVLKGVDFTIHKGEFVAVMGAVGKRKDNIIKLYFLLYPIRKRKGIVKRQKTGRS